MTKKKPTNGTVRGRLSDGAPNPIDVHVGSRVREARKIFNLSQEGLADALGITFQQVQKYEKGQNRIGASRLWDLAQVFGVSVDFFYEHLDEQAKNQSPRQICNGELREGAADLEGDFILSMNDRELIRNYKRIQDPRVAQSILDLVKSVVISENISSNTNFSADDMNPLTDDSDFCIQPPEANS